MSRKQVTRTRQQADEAVSSVSSAAGVVEQEVLDEVDGTEVREEHDQRKQEQKARIEATDRETLHRIL